MKLDYRAVALDFDGVICDSVGECLDISAEVFAQFDGVKLDLKPYRKRFMQVRWVVRTGGDFLTLWRRLIKEGPEAGGNWDFDDFIEWRQADLEEYEEFSRLFNETRARHQEKDFDGWLESHRFFLPMLQRIEEWRKAGVPIAIATTKSKDAVEKLLASIGLELPIWGREFSEDKGEQLPAIAKHFDLPLDAFLFVDDVAENLDRVAPLGPKCFLALWGYNLGDRPEDALWKTLTLEQVPAL